MTSTLEIINPINHKGWDDLVNTCEESTFFHSSAWTKALCETYHYTPQYFTLIDGNRLLALIPAIEVNSLLTGRKCVSLPFTDHCEPIINERIKFQDFFGQIITYGKKKEWKYLELRGGGTFLDEVPSSSYYFGHKLDLSQNETQILSGFKSSTKRNIKKAYKQGVSVKFSNSFESLKEFCRLNCMTRKQHGLPPQPFYFFERIFDYIISPQMGFVALAYSDNKVIAGAVFFLFGEKVLYKYGASDRSYQHLRANNLVMWETIKWSCNNGYKSLCFGRTEPENQGLRQFKAGWGTTEHLIKYYKYDLLKNAFTKDTESINVLYNKIFRKMPIPLLNIMGQLLYRHMG